jgi:hypothetical protein
MVVKANQKSGTPKPDRLTSILHMHLPNFSKKTFPRSSICTMLKMMSYWFFFYKILLSFTFF